MLAAPGKLHSEKVETISFVLGSSRAELGALNKRWAHILEIWVVEEAEGEGQLSICEEGQRPLRRMEEGGGHSLILRDLNVILVAPLKFFFAIKK